MTDDNLNLCRYCGGKAELVEFHKHDGAMVYYVICRNLYCNAATDEFDTPQEAIKHWNEGYIYGGMADNDNKR